MFVAKPRPWLPFPPPVQVRREMSLFILSREVANVANSSGVWAMVANSHLYFAFSLCRIDVPAQALAAPRKGNRPPPSFESIHSRSDTPCNLLRGCCSTGSGQSCFHIFHDLLALASRLFHSCNHQPLREKSTNPVAIDITPRMNIQKLTILQPISCFNLFAQFVLSLDDC